MSKLGKILLEFEKRFLKNEKNLGETMFSQKFTPNNSKRLIVLLSFLLLFFFISGFYFLYSINAKLRSIKTTSKTFYVQELSKKGINKVKEEPQIAPKSIVSNNIEKNITVNKAEENNNRIETKNRSEPLKNISKIEKKESSSEKDFKSLKKVKEEKIDYKEPKKEGDRVNKVIETDSIILKESGLINKLLFNAEVARKIGNFDEAIYFYEEYLKYKKDPDVYNNLGGIYYKKGDYTLAEKYFKKALELKKSEIYLINLYLTQLALGNKEICNEILGRGWSSFIEKELVNIIEHCKDFTKP